MKSSRSINLGKNPQHARPEPSPAANPRLVCVLGMHRSGTSLITRMLNVLGVYLGPGEHLMKAQEDNPKGFWEHQHITELNDAILTRLAGNWHEPPTFFPGWESAPELADLRRKARAVMREDFAAAECWGWKDPRLCLTLPFWRRLSPPMRYVLCLRNPVDVAHSLHRRDGFPIEKSARLWLTYVAAALAHTAGQARLLVFYENAMSNWEGELRRLARFVDAPELADQDVTQSTVREFFEEELQHHRTSVIDGVDDATLPFPAKSLYVALRLCAELDRDGADRSALDAMLGDCVDRIGLYAVTAQKELDGLCATMAEREKETRRDLADREADVEAARRVCDQLSSELAAARQCLDVKGTEVNHVCEARDALLVDLEAARGRVTVAEARVSTIEEQRAALERQVRTLETLTGYLGLGVRLFLGTRAYEVLGRIYRSTRSNTGASEHACR